MVVLLSTALFAGNSMHRFWYQEQSEHGRRFHPSNRMRGRI